MILKGKRTTSKFGGGCETINWHIAPIRAEEDFFSLRLWVTDGTVWEYIGSLSEMKRIAFELGARFK